MGEVASIDLKMLYFIGIFVILLILILVSFVLTSRRENRLEQGLEDAINRLQQTEQSLNKIHHSLELLSASQFDSDEQDAQNDSTIQELKSLASKLSSLAADYESSRAAQNDLRNELMTLKEQVHQNSFSVMPNAGATPVDQVNTVIQTSQYPNEFSDTSLMQHGQSMLPQMGRQRGLTPNTAISHGDGRGMGNLPHQGLNSVPNRMGPLGSQSPLPSTMGNNSIQGNMMGYATEEDTGMFMPPNSPNANQTYNPSGASSSQGMVADDSTESLAPVQSSLQSQMEQRSTTIGFKPDVEDFNSNTDQDTESAKQPEINLPSMSVVAELAVDPLLAPISSNVNDGMGSGVIEIDSKDHVLSQKNDGVNALTPELSKPSIVDLSATVDETERLAEQALDINTLAEKELSASFANSLANSLKTHEQANHSSHEDLVSSQHKADKNFPSSKLSPTEEAALAAVNSAVDEKALFGDSTSTDTNYELDQITPQDDERFAALHSFTNLYANARRKQLAQDQLQAKQLQSRLDKNQLDDAEDISNPAVQDLNASENSLSTVVTEQGTTIDFGQDMHFGNATNEGLGTISKDSVRTAAVAKVVADESKRSKQPLQEIMSPGVLQKATVVDMIYDEDYVRKQKDQKPYGINIDTLDKAHTFIDAGVSLTEISAKTGLSEDELRLLYDVDEDGKVRNSGDMFKENSALGIMQGEDATFDAKDNKDVTNTSAKSNKRKSLSRKAKNNLERKDSGKDRLKVEPNSPSAVLDKDERKEIESIMQDDNSSISNKSSDLQDESADEFSSESENSVKTSSISSNSFAEDTAQHKQFIEQIKDEEFEQNLDVIDQFADSLIKENRQKDHKRKQAKRLDAKSNLNDKAIQDGKNAEDQKATNSGSHSNIDETVQSILHDDPHGEVEIAVNTTQSASQVNVSSSSSPVAVNMLNDLDEPQLETSLDPLNILDDFKQVSQDKSSVAKVAKYTSDDKIPQEPSGTGIENLAGNNAAYLKDFNAGLDAALDDENDEVTLNVTKNQDQKEGASQTGTKSVSAQDTNSQNKGNQSAAKHSSKSSTNLSMVSSAKEMAQTTLESGLNKVAEFANKALGTNKIAQSSQKPNTNVRSGVKTTGKSNPLARGATSNGNNLARSVNSKDALSSVRSNDSTARQVVKHYGRSQNRNARGIDNVSGVNHETYEQTFGTENYARKALASPDRGSLGNEGPEKITVDMALSQMGVKKEQRNALSKGHIAKTSTAFSSVSAMNPGMADVVDISPMGMGSVDDKLPDDPAALLNQVVKGGLKSLNIESSDKIASKDESISTLEAIPVEPTKVNPSQHYANRKARNAYGMRR